MKSRSVLPILTVAAVLHGFFTGAIAETPKAGSLELGRGSASPVKAGTHRLWLVANDTEMREATTWNNTGDLILVSPGTYANVDAGGISAGVTLLSTGGSGVTLFRRDAEHRFNQDDVTVDGFTFETTSATEPVHVFGDRVKIRNSRFKPVAGEYALRATSASDLLIEGCLFDQEHGILLRSGSATGEMLIRNNELRNLGFGINGGSNSGLRLRVENNFFTNIQRDAVDLDSVQHVTIRNNIFANVVGRGADVGDIFQSSSIVHNVFYKNGQAIHACDLTVDVFDNIFQENAKGIDGCSSSNVNVHHDLIWLGTWLWAGPSYTRDSSTIWRDVRNPQFVNPAGGDFRLGASSEAKGISSDGTDLGAYGGTLGNAWTAVPGTPQSPPALLALRFEGTTVLSPGQWIGLQVEGDFENGFYSPLTNEATWTSSNEAILRSIGNGRFEGVSPGTATVTASWGGQSKTLSVTVFGASLVLSVTDSPDPVLPGGAVQYGVTWQNDGPGAMLDARLVAVYDGQASNPSASIAPDVGTDNTWTLGDLAPGTSGSLTLTVDVADDLIEGDVLDLGLTLETGFLGNFSASTSTAVAGRGDLAVTKSCQPAQAFPGDEITCSLSWANHGSGTAPGARVVESYPSGLTFLRARPAPSTGDTVWLLGDVARLTEGTIEVDLLVAGEAVGDVVNQVDILFDETDLDTADNRATFTVAVTPRADLAITLGGEPDPVAAGETLTWRQTVTNNGPSTASSLTTVQVLPAGTALAETPSGDGWSCETVSEAEAVTVTCTRGSLEVGLSSEILVPVTAPATAGTFAATAWVEAVTADPSTSNDSAQEEVTVELAQPARILLVDDDDNTPDVRGAYTTAFDVLGQSYDVWDTGSSDNEPDASILAAYEIVIWMTGDHTGGFAGPGPAAETSLAAYLDGGGCLLVSSQDYLWDRGGATHDVPTGLMASYLGLLSGASDVGQSTVTGIDLFDGQGPHNLSFPYGNFTDRLTPDATASVAWSGDAGDVAVLKATSVYGTSFWGFGLEALPTAAAREEAVAGFLVFCNQVAVSIFADAFESGSVGAWSSSVP